MAVLTLHLTSVRSDPIDSQQRRLALECYQGPVIDGRVRYGSVGWKSADSKGLVVDEVVGVWYSLEI